MKYTRKEAIYHGPICDIYKGEDPQGNEVALKVADLDFERKPHNFRQEIQILKKLQHPNIADFIDSFTLGEDQVLVMPFYATDMVGVMAHFLKKRVKFDFVNPLANKTVVTNEIPLLSIRPMVSALEDALRYIHQQGIIHRDIKPANIMFRSILELDSPIIGDFGISYDESRNIELATDKITDVGTGYYKAPELCFGVSDYGPEVDLWSLGLVISYLCSKNGTPCNAVQSSDNEKDQQPELNDFVLIQGTFAAFGTPTVTDSASPLFWAKLADPNLHFVKFQYRAYDRKPLHELLPRCQDEEIVQTFNQLTQYSHRHLTAIAPKKL